MYLFVGFLWWKNCNIFFKKKKRKKSCCVVLVTAFHEHLSYWHENFTSCNKLCDSHLYCILASGSCIFTPRHCRVASENCRLACCFSARASVRDLCRCPLSDPPAGALCPGKLDPLLAKLLTYAP